MKERDIVKDIMEYLNGLKNVWVWKNHGSAYTTPGIADIVGCYRGRFLAIEVKTPSTRNNVSKVQELFIRKIRESGGLAFVAISADEVRERIN